MTTINAASSTPEGISIEARQPIFDLKAALATDWLENDPFLTAVFNALSLSFPSGEKHFISSVRHYEEQVTDEKLLQELRGFYRQEGSHSREHNKYNKMLCEQRGYDLEDLENIYLKRIEKSRSNPKMFPMAFLATTVAAEHFTASMAELMLEHDMLGKADPTIKKLWRWHALEELEHKAVTFDVYTQVGGKYALRATMMRLTTLFYYIDTFRVVSRMLRHDHQLWKWKTLKSFSRFMFSKESFIRQYRRAYKDFFREDFHPWNVDSRALLNRWEEELASLQKPA